MGVDNNSRLWIVDGGKSDRGVRYSRFEDVTEKRAAHTDAEFLRGYVSSAVACGVPVTFPAGSVELGKLQVCIDYLIRTTAS